MTRLSAPQVRLPFPALASGSLSQPPEFDVPPLRNERLAALIVRLIERGLGSRIHDLHVEVEGDTIRLRGTCLSFHAKQLAQHAAMGVAAGGVIENRILVR